MNPLRHLALRDLFWLMVVVGLAAARSLKRDRRRFCVT